MFCLFCIWRTAFWNVSMYYHYFVIINHWKSVFLNLRTWGSLYPKILCAKFVWIWPYWHNQFCARGEFTHWLSLSAFVESENLTVPLKLKWNLEACNNFSLAQSNRNISRITFLRFGEVSVLIFSVDKSSSDHCRPQPSSNDLVSAYMFY